MASQKMFFIIIVLSSIILVDKSVYSQDEDHEAIDASRQLMNEARVSFNLAKFQEAADKFSRAYELYNAPAFLFNIGQCHRELGNLERAIFFYTVYLREAPDAENRKDVETVIAELEQEIQSQGEETPPIPKGVPEAEVEPNEEIGKKKFYRRWWFWTAIVGVVSASVVVGVVVPWAVSQDDEPQYVLPGGSSGTIDWR